MTCSILDLYIDGQASPQQEQAFESHLEACSACESALGTWHETHDVLVEWAEQRSVASPRNDASQRQADVIIALSRERLGQRRRSLTSLALAAAASFFLALLLFGGEEPEQIAFRTEVVYREGASSELSEDVLTVLGKGRLVAQIGEDRIGLGNDAVVRVLGANVGDVQLRLEQGNIGVAASKRTESDELVVRAGRYAVRVLGTRFRVQHPQSGGFEVAVDEGTVEVTAPGQRWFIDAGRSLSLDDEGRAIMHQRETSDSQLDHLMSSTSAPAPLIPQQSGVRGKPELDVGVTEVLPSSLASPVAPPEPVMEAPPVAVPVGLDYAALRGQLARNDASSVRDVLRSHLEEEPNSLPAWQLLAIAERKVGDAAAAVAAYRRVIVLGAPAEVGRA